MNIRECKVKLLQLDPYEIVQCGLDGFSPYVYLELPDSINDSVDQFSDFDQEQWSEFVDEYVSSLQSRGSVETISSMNFDLQSDNTKQQGVDDV
mgnify:CR=1 FL=1|jgi:hypothetical protein